MESYSSYITDMINDVDKPLRIEGGKSYILLMTSGDVIHSFSVPGLKLKRDCIPGRLNSAQLLADRYGRFAGYCRELCGAGHAYMPIVVEVVKFDERVRAVEVSPRGFWRSLFRFVFWKSD